MESNAYSIIYPWNIDVIPKDLNPLFISKDNEMPSTWGLKPRTHLTV